jgi:hypothetical protein
MPGCSQSILPPSPPPPWTVSRAQAALTDAAAQVLGVTDLLEEIHEGLPPPADIDDRQEGRKPYDVATDILGTIECVVCDDLWPAIESLVRSAQVTDEDLRRAFYGRPQGRRR